MTFTSKRLQFRFWTEQDFELFYSIFSNEEIMKYALMDCVETNDALLPYFQQVLTNNDTPAATRIAYDYAVFERDTNAFVGFADMEIINYNEHGGNGEIGYFLHPTSWGKGYATEIATALLSHGFEEIGLHRVCASCNCNNIASQNILRKIGMNDEGIFKKARFKHGEWVDELRYGILIEEWNKRKS